MRLVNDPPKPNGLNFLNVLNRLNGCFLGLLIDPGYNAALYLIKAPGIGSQYGLFVFLFEVLAFDDLVNLFHAIVQ